VGTLTATRTVEIDAPLARCYEIITDLSKTPDWQDQMVSLETLERDSEGRSTLVEIKSDIRIRTVTTRMRFAHHPPDSMTWEQEKGEFKWLKGSWELEDIGEKTRAVYTLTGDPGRIFSLLLRGPVEGKVKELMTKDATEGLKRAAEAG
jgi:ribosome-associated toxin RatA of RatAB toxin-antitoxin module